ncbi:putative tRNA threonylcarbamoyladenosine biosynthesis protein osgepl1 [Fasciola gigantica]|uniref:N(6)-L-threonylcarbamoyladenine synthase n=1 Tax=Fasciola gigantica TaxID=46835 RepID=A0A504YYR8_FASGI|nr:putative tRNA threonylcarbamoyladenosine biosynthesis protein osgepl1 [Fasciola gigantica]
MNIFKSQLLRAISILNGIELLFSRNSRRCYILGLETSCDDTGASVISQDGIVVSEKVQSQTKFSVFFGGVLPAVARELHQRSITQLTESVMREAGLTWTNLDAVAVTVKPGMPLSLKVGVSYAKEIAQKYTLPIIPIHHMEAHALTAQLIDPGLQFPFLVLLLSGGHGLLALARGLEDFVLLGTALDASPGDVLDKVCLFRSIMFRMKLSDLIIGTLTVFAFSLRFFFVFVRMRDSEK